MSERPAARLYVGHVMHMRLIPRRHQFRHRVFSVLVDLDRLDQVLGTSRLLSHNRGWILSIHDKDHGARDGSPLRPWIDAELAKASLPAAARVEMLSFPRVLGYGFNPLTVYYCRDAQDRLSALVYEVKNTFGDQTAYVVPAGDASGGHYRQRHGKEMYVSPFIEMDQTYRFTLNDPDNRMAFRIRQAGPEGETLIATHTAEARPLSDRTLARVLVTHPLLSFGVVGLIHWHALRLFLKGVRFHRYSKSQIFRKRVAEA